jgi:hypothetical protein
MMDRREFVQACAVLLGSSVMLAGCGSDGSGSDGSSSTNSADGINGTSGDGSEATGSYQNRWMQLPSTTFSVTHQTFGVIDMELTSVDDEMHSPKTEQFSVVLTGPDNPLFPEGTYQMYNDSLGYIDLYLQPGANALGQQTYRAVFSILEQAA